MWEDNNPLSYNESSPTESHFPPYEDPSPPASRDSNDDHGPPNFITRANRTPSEYSQKPADGSDDSDDSDDEEYRRMRKEKGYSSRVEQMLLEDKNVPIVIADAGKNHEGSGGFIVYTICTGVRICDASATALRSSQRARLQTLTWCRILKFADDTQSSNLYVETCRFCILALLSHQFRRSIKFRIMSRRLPAQRRT